MLIINLNQRINTDMMLTYIITELLQTSAEPYFGVFQKYPLCLANYKTSTILYPIFNLEGIGTMGNSGYHQCSHCVYLLGCDSLNLISKSPSTKSQRRFKHIQSLAFFKPYRRARGSGLLLSDSPKDRSLVWRVPSSSLQHIYSTTQFFMGPVPHNSSIQCLLSTLWVPGIVVGSRYTKEH